MNREQILDTIKTLSRSQGMYRELLKKMNNLEAYDEEMTELENQHFNDPIELILYLEA